MPYDEKLAKRLRVVLASRAGVAEKKMFGGICWMFRGHMLCGVEVGRFMFRVGKDRDAEALAKPGATPMDITGKPMKGFVWVDAKKTAGNETGRVGRVRGGVRRHAPAAIFEVNSDVRDYFAAPSRPISNIKRSFNTCLRMSRSTWISSSISFWASRAALARWIRMTHSTRFCRVAFN